MFAAISASLKIESQLQSHIFPASDCNIIFDLIILSSNHDDHDA